VTLTNIGTSTLNISGIAIVGTDPGDFNETNNCGVSLPPGGHCTFSLIFTPTQLGPRTAALTITDNAPGSPQSIPLSGFGVTSGPNATLSTTSLTFALQLVGTTSPAQSVTLSNYGTMQLNITSIIASGDFSQSNTCGSSLAPLASCTISVTFTPTQSGTRTGTLSVADNAPGSPQMVSLTGVGTVVELNPTSLSFGNVPVGQQSSPKQSTLTNVGSTRLNISSITITGADPGDFSQMNNCGTGIGGHGSCTITVTFRPTVRGTRSADVSISDDGGGSPQQVSLSGVGCTYNQYHKCIGAGEGLGRFAARYALAANQTTSVPRPTGTSRIGTRVMRLVDNTRDDPYVDNRSKRELLVRFWYPASNEDCKPAEYTSSKVWSYFSELVGLPGPEIRTNSCLDTPVLDGAHPVVVFTPGYTGTFTDYTFILEDLASRGYIVASVDHTYEATAAEFPDGRLVRGVLGSHLGHTWQIDDETLRLALSVRSADLKFVVDELERLNATNATEEDSPFAGRLDTSRIGLMGHSLGGLATISGVQQDPRFGSAVLLDAELGDETFAGTDKAVLILAAGRERWSESECALWSNLRGPRIAVNLRGAEHVTLTDAVWLAKGAIKTGPMGPEKTIEGLRNYLAAFLDTNLRGKPIGPLLSGPSSEYPDAEVITQKQLLCGKAIEH
jgi:dienelactone hydrolase